MNNHVNRFGKAFLAILITSALLVIAACGSNTPASGAESGKPQSGTETSGVAASKPAKEITIGYIPWDEDIAISYLWKALLEKKGYKVKLVQAEVAPLFSGVANGSIDLFMDLWMPNTHSTMMEKFGNQVDVLGTWYDQADSGLAVPDYVDVKSIAELKANKDKFKGKIIGIEAGAGLMRITRDGALPGYGLKEWQLVESSTPTMLAELEKAISKKEPIVVTLWRPHWAFSKFNIRFLEDPQKIMNPQGAEKLQIISRKGFAKDYPEVSKWFGQFKMTLDELAKLESSIQTTKNEDKGVQDWLAENNKASEPWLK